MFWLAKNVLASKWLLRKNSNSVPWNCCSALDRHVNDRAGGIAELGRSVARHYLDFLQRIHGRRVTEPVVHGIVDVDTIEQEVIRLLAVAVDEGASGKRDAVLACSDWFASRPVPATWRTRRYGR